MINSIDSFEGKLKYDPANGSLIIVVPSPENTIPLTREPSKDNLLFLFSAHSNLQLELSMDIHNPKI
jgi:hypothetical protein